MRQREAAGKAGLQRRRCGRAEIQGSSSEITRKLAEELGIGEPTLRDIVKEAAEKPGRDPRDEMPPDPPHRRAGYEGPEGRHDLKRNRPQRH